MHGHWAWQDGRPGTLRIWEWNCWGARAPRSSKKDTSFHIMSDNEFLCDQVSPGGGRLIRRRMWYIGEFHVEAWNIALLNSLIDLHLRTPSMVSKVMSTVG